MAQPWTADELYTIREIGHMLLTEGKHALARNVFEGLVEIDPRDAYAHLSLGLALRGLGETARAARALETALSLDNTLWNAAIHLAEIHLERKEGELAHQSAALAERIARTPRCPEEVRQRARRLVELANQPAAR